MEARKEGIQAIIKALRNLNHDDSEIKSAIMEQYSLTEEKADKYLQSS
ncbi:MAG: hypothetical protein HFH60_01840 [Lachnospiraceae bacterium]|nr:hypothetical protein [Lachnospiraceae bacterium]